MRRTNSIKEIYEKKQKNLTPGETDSENRKSLYIFKIILRVGKIVPSKNGVWGKGMSSWKLKCNG